MITVFWCKFVNMIKKFFLQIAAEISAPLAKTDEIVLLGDDRATSEVSRLLASMPPSIQALTGVDITKVTLVCYVENSSVVCFLFWISYVVFL